MQYLGTLKRRMYRVLIDTDSCPSAGTALFSPSSASGQGAGKVMDARPGPDGGCEALVVTQISSMEAGDLHLGDADGPVLRTAELPYAFEAEKAGT
jgi:folate-binding Fe-S cluster repair protein YgfZ